jgi:uncharacterized Zn-finger protein
MHVRAFACTCAFFSEQTALRLHEMRLHAGRAPLTCQFCHMEFVSRAPLDAHLRSHTGQKPFPCTKCSAMFRTKSNLRRHEDGVHGGRKWLCSFCGMGFSQKTSLEYHVAATHTNTRPFWCKVDGCTASFPDKSACRAHVKKTHVT